jgi:hypothetical protein
MSESLETIFGLKILNFLMRIRSLFDPGSGMEKFGSGINIPSPQYVLSFPVLVGNPAGDAAQLYFELINRCRAIPYDL